MCKVDIAGTDSALPESLQLWIGQDAVAHGVFTWAPLNALKNGDTNSNGTIELSELVTYVQNVIPELAAKSGGTGRGEVAIKPTLGKQTARFGSRGEDFTLALVVQLEPRSDRLRSKETRKDKVSFTGHYVVARCALASPKRWPRRSGKAAITRGLPSPPTRASLWWRERR